METAFLVAIFALALFIRTYQLDLFPPGLYNDEAAHGIDALSVLDGDHAVFFERNNGREPLFIYLLTLIFGISGATAYNIRLAAALCGAATVVTSYWCVREAFRFAADEYARTSRWYAMWTALFLTFSYWHITFSRIGFRAIMLPLLTTIVFAFMWRAWRHLRTGGSIPWTTAILTGIMLGLALYTYTAGRFAIPLFVLTAVATAVVASSYGIKRASLWKTTALILASATITALPLAFYFLSNPSTFGEHAAFVSIFNRELAGNNPVIAMMRSTGKMLLMFFSEADRNPRHNPAKIPVFDPLMAIWLAFGIVVALFQWRKLPSLFSLFWFGLFLLPAALTAEGIPHSLRALGMIPIVYALPLIAMAWSGQFLPGRLQALAGWIPLPFLVIASVVSLNGYFGSLNRVEQFEAPFFAGLWELAESIEASDANGDIAAAETIWILPLPLGEDLTDHELYTARFAAQDQGNLFTLHLDEATIADELTELTQGVGTVNVLRTYGVSDLTYYDTRFMDSKGLLNLMLRGNSDSVVSGGFQADVPYSSYFLVDTPNFSLPDGERKTDLTFGDTVVLESAAVSSIGKNGVVAPDDSIRVPSDGEIGVVLRWRSLQPLDGNLKVNLSLVNDDGKQAGQVDDILAGDGFPRRPQWPADEPTSTYHVLNAYPGIPPGDYTMTVSVYDEESNQVYPVSTDDGGTLASAPLSNVSVEPSLLPLEAAGPQIPLDNADLAPEFQLLGLDLPRQQFRPGDSVELTLYSRLRQETDIDYRLQVQVKDEAGEIVAEYVGGPGGEEYPTSAWREGEVVRNWFTPRLDAKMPNGDYSLVATAITGAETEEDGPVHRPVELAKIEVKGHQRLYEMPKISQPMGVNYGDLVQLLGVSGPATISLSPGEMLTTTLIWQPLRSGDQQLIRFTQLLDDSGSLVAQEDTVPCRGECPATSWLADEFITDMSEIALPPDLPPGSYTLITGWYDPALQQRLAATDQLGNGLENQAATLPIAVQVDD